MSFDITFVPERFLANGTPVCSLIPVNHFQVIIQRFLVPKLIAANREFELLDVFMNMLNVFYQMRFS